MEINIEREGNTKGPYYQIYTVTLGNKAITTTWVRSESDLKEWIRMIQVVYGKRNRHDIVVGFSADRSCNYANGNYSYKKGSCKDDPFELLQLCVGCHCLLYNLEGNDSNLCPRVLKDFFYDRHTIVVGVGIEKLVNKLQKENNGLLIPRLVELRELAGAETGGQGNDFSRYNLGKLANEVLGGEMGQFVKPNKMIWWEQGNIWRFLSDDLVKYATVEAFLACEMGSKLLKNGN